MSVSKPNPYEGFLARALNVETPRTVSFKELANRAQACICPTDDNADCHPDCTVC